MHRPMASQITSRIQFSLGNDSIRAMHKSMPSDGKTGENGHLKGRSRSGSTYRRMSTDAHTHVKANKVPMLVRSARMLNGSRLAADATTKPVRIVELDGVCHLGWTAPKKPIGINPSRAIAKKIPGCPIIITSNTDVMPAIAPMVTMNWVDVKPTCSKARATGAFVSILSFGTIPVSTAETAI